MRGVSFRVRGGPDRGPRGGGLLLDLDTLEAADLREGADDGGGVVDEGLRHIVAGLGNVGVRDATGVLRHVLQRHALELDLILLALDAADRDGAVDVGGRRVLDGGGANGGRFLRVVRGTDAREGTLQVAEGVGAHALDVGLVLDDLDEIVAEGARAGELDVAVGVDFLGGGRGDGDGRSGGVGDAFGDGDEAAAVFGDAGLDVGDELVDAERALGQVDEVRAGAFVGAGEGGGGGQEAGVAAHDDVDLDARQRRVVEVVAHEGLRDELGGGSEAGGVVVFAQVVVDGLGDVEAVELVLVLLGRLVDDVGGLGGVVAADVEEVADVVLLELLEDGEAVVVGGLLADGAEGGGGGLGDEGEGGGGFAAEVDEILVEDALDAVEGTVDLLDFLVLLGFEDRADEALVDDDGRPAALRDSSILYSMN